MNEVEKKEIEEMARTMGKCKKYKNCEDCIEVYKKVLDKKVKLKDCELYCEATTLYNAGYGKVDDYKKEIIEQSHKITDLTQRNIGLKQEIARLKEKTSFIITARQDGKLSQVRNYICEIEQQVIKEFANKVENALIKFIQENEDCNDSIKSAYLYVEFLGIKDLDGNIISYGVLDDLLKEYGIGEE